MKNKKLMVVLFVMAVAAITITSGYTLSYFTDQASKEHTFTVGKINIELSEPEWSAPDKLLPQQILKTSPQITNTGDNDAYIFVQVDVPCREVITADVDGKKLGLADTELFAFEVSKDWAQIGDVVKDEEEQIHTYTYAYVTEKELCALEPADMIWLYEHLQFVNVIEGQELEEVSLSVEVRAYAIQKDHLGKKDAQEKEEPLKPQEVWEIIYEQRR